MPLHRIEISPKKNVVRRIGEVIVALLGDEFSIDPDSPSLECAIELIDRYAPGCRDRNLTQRGDFDRYLFESWLPADIYLYVAIRKTSINRLVMNIRGPPMVCESTIGNLRKID